jgi:hypothetical protein
VLGREVVEIEEERRGVEVRVVGAEGSGEVGGGHRSREARDRERVV